ncbi:breast cancer type 2 susceptibility protein homolog isoform X2 [Belonocnema kinseyi]|uniref:breast cancer type 2 susceptibility protein homolog isoform X2 n=1 Tax=Belonocnema kinseyi TaxID=2817044 RepID=UPI00143DB2E0|nr:breast cancer type 2 susceptibility protein homolog isoform X2 [Belonocnema kinseyi]
MVYKFKSLTPVLENVKYEYTESSSPILNKKVRKRPKRRIFKTNTSENIGTPQDLEERIQDEEFSQNDDRLQESRISPLLDQFKTETNNPNLISSPNIKKSSPTSLNSNILQANINPDFSKPSTSSVEKSLGDIVRDIKRTQKKRRVASEMKLANFSEIDLFKDAIQLECASTKFSDSTKEVPGAVSQIGLVPFSKYCLEVGEEPNSKDEKQEETSRGNEEVKEKGNHEGREIVGSSRKQSTYSKPVRIFNNSSRESSKKRKGCRDSSETVLTLKEEEEILNESIVEDFQFSQWLYISKDEEKKDVIEIVESQNSENESKATGEDIEILADFTNELQKEDVDERSDIEIITRVSEGTSKETIPLCEFLTTKGKRIQINEDKLETTKSVFKEVQGIDLDNEFSEDLTPGSEKLSQKHLVERSNREIMKQVSAGFIKENTVPNCGFSTAKGKPIQVNEEKLRMAKSVFKDVENIEDIDLTSQSPKELLQFANKISINDLDEQSDPEIIKQVSLGSSKEATVPNFGFLTAKGKPIQISQDKLLKAKSVFKDVENIKDIDITSQSPKELLQFDYKFSKRELDERSDRDIIKLNSAGSSKEETVPNFGFSTAKGKPIHINEGQLLQAKSVFKDVENVENIHLENEFSKDLTPDLEKSSNLEIVKQVSAELIKESSCLGFSTAKGKSIQINADKLRKAKSVFKDVEDIDLITESFPELPPDLEKSADVEITRQVAEESIKERTIEDIDFITEFTKDVTPQDLKKSADINRAPNLINFKPISLDFKREVPKAATSCGFSTAKGTSIEINNEKLRRAEMIFKDVENIEGVLETAAEEFELTKSNNVLESKQKDSPNVGAKLISGFSLASAKTSSINEAKNPISELKNNSVTGFCTAGGKSIAISEQKLMRAMQMYDETVKDNFISKDKALNNIELYNKENEAGSSLVNISVPSTSKVQAPSNSDVLNKYTCSMKRKLSEEVSINSKRLRTADFPTRNSVCLRKSFNPVIVKSMPEVCPLNKDMRLSLNGLKDVVNLPTCDLIVPKVQTVQSGFVTACGKKIVISDEKKQMAEKLYENIEAEDVIASSSKSVLPKRNFSLPCTSGNKESVDTKKRRSLQTESSNVKNIEQLRKDFQQMRRDQLRNHIFIKPLTQSKSYLINWRPESPPFSGFDSNDSVKSTTLFLKSEEYLREEEIILIKRNEPELGENLSKISSLNAKVREEDKSETDKIDKDSCGLYRVSDEALQKELEFSELSVQFKPEISNQILTSNPTLKRSINDVDSETPLGRNFASKTKKAKVTRDLQGRKLFSEDSESEDEFAKISTNVVTSSANKFELEISTRASPILSGSIIESVEILQKDLKDFNETRLGIKYNQEIVKEKENNLEDARRSPILGKRKRRRRVKDVKPVEERSGIKREDRCNSDANIDSRTSSQSVETDSVVIDSDILERRISAVFEQDMVIARKKKQRPKPIKGSLLDNREQNRNCRISLHRLSSGSAPIYRSIQELKEKGIDPDVLEISASTAGSYKFRIADVNRVSNRNLVSLDVGDGGRLILDSSGSAGVTEFERAFEASPGVDPKLLPPDWVRNHYRWIVWKLASMDRVKLGCADIPRMLMPDRVLKDLKYRYDREIDRSQRSAIRKILEKDDVPSKRMVLCIATIEESTDNEKNESDPRILLRTPRWKVEVTDGWYSLPASFDAVMVKKIIDGKVQEGTKIVTYGAELLNCDRGCFPLEKSADVCLKIHTNSTRRARWDAKLGYQRQSGPIPTSLKNIDPNGGLIGKVTVVVSRIYPTLFREKTADGQSIYRNAKNEEKAQAAYEQAFQSKVEAIVSKLQEKYEGKQNSSEEDSSEYLINYDSGSYLTESQKQKLMDIRQAKQERLQNKIAQEIEANRSPPRNVVPVQKVRIVEGETNAILTIWSKSEEVSILKEGGCFSIFSISAYGNGFRDGDLNLTASRQAVFKPEPNMELSYPSRIYTPLKDVAASGFEPPYCELDTVGIVSWIGNTPHGMKNFEAVYLSYPNEDTSSSTYLSILFWQGISSHGFANILTVGSLIACSNLECRRTRNALWTIPVCYCSERTIFTQNPRQAHLLEAFEDLKTRISDPIAYSKKCGDEISSLIPKKPVSRVSAQAISNVTPVSGIPGFNSPNFSMAKTPLDVETPAKSSATQKRLDKLACYGQPPEISPIVFRNSSNVTSNFRPVIRTPDLTKSRKIPPDST